MWHRTLNRAKPFSFHHRTPRPLPWKRHGLVVFKVYQRVRDTRRAKRSLILTCVLKRRYSGVGVYIYLLIRIHISAHSVLYMHACKHPHARGTLKHNIEYVMRKPNHESKSHKTKIIIKSSIMHQRHVKRPRVQNQLTFSLIPKSLDVKPGQIKTRTTQKQES